MLEYLHPYKIESSKLRLGPLEDGGYVVNDTCFDKSSALFTYGVGNDMRFEEEYSDRFNKPSFLFDHTIGRPTGWALRDNLYFYNEGLGFKESCKDFIEHYRQVDAKGDILLKVDIEGGEYEWLEQTDVKSIADRTVGFLLEVHWLGSQEYRRRLTDILKNLYKYFTLTHIHGNVWGAIISCEGFDIPETFELTLVNNRYIRYKEKDTAKYPIEGLDVSNRPGFPDFELKFINGSSR